MLHRSKVWLIPAISAIAVSDANAQSIASRMFQQQARVIDRTWVDGNFVPCKGMGIGATGKVRVIVRWKPFLNEGVTIESLELTTDYVLRHEPAASVTYTDIDNQISKVVLQRPWFATVRSGNDSSKSLVLPKGRFDFNNRENSNQVTLSMPARSRTITINLRTQFQTDSGACFSSFEARLPIQ